MAQIATTLAHPSCTEPIVEIPRTLRTPKYYTPEEMKEEMNKVKAAQIRVAISFEHKLRDTIMYLIDRVNWPTFYIEIAKFSNILKRLNVNEPIVRTILHRWIKREHELIVLCTEVVGLPSVSRIEEVFD